MALNSDDVEAYVELKWFEVKPSVDAANFPALEREGVEKLTKLSLGKGFLDGWNSALHALEKKLSTPKKR